MPDAQFHATIYLLSVDTRWEGKLERSDGEWPAAILMKCLSGCHFMGGTADRIDKWSPKALSHHGTGIQTGALFHRPHGRHCPRSASEQCNNAVAVVRLRGGWGRGVSAFHALRARRHGAGMRAV